MKRKVLFAGILLMTVFAANTLISCSGCKREQANDLSSVTGSYAGKATLILPEGVKAMLQQDSSVKTRIPQEPVSCRIKATLNDKKKVELQLEDFKMPSKQIQITPMVCTVTADKGTFSLEGQGVVTAGQQKITYTQKGSIRDKKMQLEITVPIVPMVLEAKIQFEGEKK